MVLEGLSDGRVGTGFDRVECPFCGYDEVGGNHLCNTIVLIGFGISPFANAFPAPLSNSPTLWLTPLAPLISRSPASNVPSFRPSSESISPSKDGANVELSSSLATSMGRWFENQCGKSLWTSVLI